MDTWPNNIITQIFGFIWASMNFHMVTQFWPNIESSLCVTNKQSQQSLCLFRLTGLGFAFSLFWLFLFSRSNGCGRKFRYIWRCSSHCTLPTQISGHPFNGRLKKHQIWVSYFFELTTMITTTPDIPVGWHLNKFDSTVPTDSNESRWPSDNTDPL